MTKTLYSQERIVGAENKLVLIGLGSSYNLVEFFGDTDDVVQSAHFDNLDEAIKTGNAWLDDEERLSGIDQGARFTHPNQ
jgi:predicted NACHT family NTPase